MLREDTVFGPIHSRRLGSSLGINLLPREGKICNFDCIYCECGWNKDGLDDQRLPSFEEVHNALETKLQDLRAHGIHIDSITFAGDGEPTIHPKFPEIIEDTLKLRAQYYPEAKISVLSNATRVHVPAVFEALTKVDNPIMKIDAPSDELIARINRPAPGYKLERVIEALKAFKGNFVLQTMMLKSPDFDSSSPEVITGWMDIVRELKPREIMVYTVDRPTPADKVEKLTSAQMSALVAPLLAEGFSIDIKG